jgi:WD40 repeat protein
MVKCWDLEANKVIRHYHGHLSGVYSLSLHPTLDVLVTAGRDASARVWDMRSKAQVHVLAGHTATVADVKCQESDPQVITGSMDSTVRYARSFPRRSLDNDPVNPDSGIWLQEKLWSPLPITKSLFAHWLFTPQNIPSLQARLVGITSRNGNVLRGHLFSISVDITPLLIPYLSTQKACFSRVVRYKIGAAFSLSPNGNREQVTMDL